MLRFTFFAKDDLGRTKKGIIEAKDDKDAASILQQRGLFVVNIVRIAAPSVNESIIPGLQKISMDDIVEFTRQFSTMITAGLSLTEALSILKDQVKNPLMVKVVSQISDDVEGGKSLATAMSRFSKHFPRIYLSLVKAGEASGSLNEVLSRLADNLEKQKDFRGKVQGALIYPTIVVIGMAVVTFVMMTFVIPKMTSLYKDFGVALPTPTLILITLSNFFVSYWYLMIGTVVIIASLGTYWLRTAKGRYLYDQMLLNIPIFGRIIKETALVEVTRTLAILIGAGIPILEAIDIAKEAVDNVLYREALEDAGTRVEKGFSLGSAFSENAIFPQILGQMVTVGEETGKLDDSMGKLSRYFESESEMAIKALTTAIEPLIMIVLGLGVGFLVMAILMPIYSLTSQF